MVLVTIKKHVTEKPSKWANGPLHQYKHKSTTESNDSDIDWCHRQFAKKARQPTSCSLTALGVEIHELFAGI